MLTGAKSSSTDFEKQGAKGYLLNKPNTMRQVTEASTK